GVILRAASSASMVTLSGRTSQNTGVAPAATTACAQPTNVSEGTTTSSPGDTPSVTSAACSAAVPEETATTCPAPTSSASLDSNSLVRFPIPSQRDSSTRRTASASASPTAGRKV